MGSGAASSSCRPHAGDWLEATPDKNLDLTLKPAEFSAAVAFRLGVNTSDVDDWYPKCDRIMESTSDHAVACAAGGERTRRHNTLRYHVSCVLKQLACEWNGKKKASSKTTHGDGPVTCVFPRGQEVCLQLWTSR